jgi:hypothetical protein
MIFPCFRVYSQAKRRLFRTKMRYPAVSPNGRLPNGDLPNGGSPKQYRHGGLLKRRFDKSPVPQTVLG